MNRDINFLQYCLDKGDFGNHIYRNNKIQVANGRETLEDFLEDGYTECSAKFCLSYNDCYYCPFYSDDEILDDDGKCIDSNDTCYLPEDLNGLIFNKEK